MASSKLARVDEIPPGQTKVFSAGQTPVIVTNCRGEIYALYGRRPHRDNPLDGAMLWGCLLDCPWHHFQYDVRTGEDHSPKNVYPTDYAAAQEQLRPLKTYPVRIEGGDIWVDLE